MEEVVLVDTNDQVVGVQDKLSAHLEGRLHRAFSVFLFNAKGEMLLQQRAFEKYHSGGKWTNTCCSHPRLGEDVKVAAKRRLIEEMGICCEVEKIFEFIYQAELDQGIIEYEFDHVFIGLFSHDAKPNPEEVFSIRWISLENLDKEMGEFPERFTFWFQKIMKEERGRLLNALQSLLGISLHSR